MKLIEKRLNKTEETSKLWDSPEKQYSSDNTDDEDKYYSNASRKDTFARNKMLTSSAMPLRSKKSVIER